MPQPSHIWTYRVSPLLGGVWALAVVVSAVAWVDLVPQVEADFFFAADDPQLAESNAIQDRFPAGETVIVRATGDDTATLMNALPQVSASLATVPGVTNVFSAATESIESPLWGRILNANSAGTTNIVLQVESVDAGLFLDSLDGALAPHREAGLTFESSGVTVIVELIRRSLRRDLVVFSSAALLLFGLALALVYRSAWIVAGTLSACLAACGSTLWMLQLIGVKVGLLTANIITIVFVLTLSHTVFLIANWKSPPNNASLPDQAVSIALANTVTPSLWCMTTTVLGFLSLWLASARPLQELGTAGAIGTVVAFLSAYTILPGFLARASGALAHPGAGAHSGKSAHPAKVPNLDPEHSPGILANLWLGRWGLGAVALAVLALGVGIPNLNTDPSLLTYFDPTGSIRPGLEAIDIDGGSSPLLLALRDAEGEPLDTREAYDRMWVLQEALEADPSTGVILSPAPLIAHARTSPLAAFLPTPVLIGLLEQPQFGGFAESVIAPSREEVLFSIRMVESSRSGSRQEVIDRLVGHAEEAGFVTTAVGGLYELQGRLADLIRASLGIGLGGLLVLFIGIGWVVSRQVVTTAWMVLSLATIPIVILGVFAWTGLAVDIITSPAANVALAMGVDSLIHLVTRARRLGGGIASGAAPWRQARNEVASPVLAATAIISIGFGIFALSNFPPTQRFGLAVVLGTVTAAGIALLLLPSLASTGASTSLPEPFEGAEG